MNEPLRRAVTDALDYLTELQAEGVRPAAARTRLQPLRGRHPDLQIDLLAEEQAFDRSVHYDALLRESGRGTVSISYCPERALPWPLRGVHRWSEADLVRVNGNVLQVEAAMACLDFIWDQQPVIDRLVSLCLIHEELERKPIELTDAELQAAMDQFRAAKKLFSSEQTRQWLERHGMSQEKLEAYVAETAIVPKLRDRIAADRVDDYFREHRADFDTARVARLEIQNQSRANDLAAQIQSGQRDFFAVAQALYADITEPRLASSALFQTIERRQADPALREQLFAAASGDLIGPVASDGCHLLLRVLSIAPAQLDDHTRSRIKEVLFDQWLEERRAEVDIEWCWGNASQAID